ncbi:TetR/AcrR family transcriptional regulator [Fodinicola feengrottensis]|uniref:TetR/AcrR family transcriptional regulator n=2 Tax=Fodinicola feengrottensis TaxID=435914 RepID=A0ABN2IJF1_9ACTN
MLETAQGLFGRQGYHATGVNQILAEAAAPKGSLYFHFPGGKEQLAAEAVSLGATDLGQVIDAVLEHAPDPASAIRTMGDLLTARLESSGFLDGCPIASVALDVADSPTVRSACDSGYAGWLASITDHLTQAGLAEATAAELAVLVLSGLEGALLLARTRQDTAPLVQVANRLAAVVTQEIQELCA